MRDLCLEYFRKLDTYIERLVELAGPEAQVFMASDHGFTATTEVVRINSFLEEKGYLAWRQSDGSDLEQRREASNFANLDWEKTLAFCPTSSSNGIVIRVAKKPGDTGIKPEDYEEFREKLIRELENLKDEETGERIIQKVHKREDVYSGPALLEAPDLTLVLRDYGFVSINNVKPVVGPREPAQGTHHPDGILLAGGYGIKSDMVGELHQVADLPVTMLYSLGLPIPEDLEGRVAESFFTQEYLAGKPIVIGGETDAIAPASQNGKNGKSEEISEDEKQKILDQLQMLGYME